MKCPFMGGKPIPYNNVCINHMHIPQIMLEMFCTSTQECHYVVWTPIGTKVLLVKRDDKYIELLINYLFNLHGMKMYLVSHTKIRKLPQKVPVLISFIPNSLTTSNVLSHGDLKTFETIDCGVKPVQKKMHFSKMSGL